MLRAFRKDVCTVPYVSEAVQFIQMECQLNELVPLYGELIRAWDEALCIATQIEVGMKRLIYAFDALASSRDSVEILAREGIDRNCISLIAQSNIEMDEIPGSLLDVSTDFIPALGRGAAVGGIAGMFAGLIAMAIPPLGIALGGPALIGFFAGGSLVGAWSSALVGASVPNEVRRRFEDEITAGRTLLVVDCSAKTEQLVSRTMATRADQHLVWQGDIAKSAAI